MDDAPDLLPAILSASTDPSPQHPHALDEHTAAHQLCPYATSTTAYDIDTRDSRYIAGGCRKWSCAICGPRKRSQLVRRIVKARPSRMLTLTCRHEDTVDAQTATIKKALPRLITELRRKHGPIEYCRIQEQCKDGYPHFHLLVRSGFLPHEDVRSCWTKNTGATIVDIRKAHGKSVAYVSKYISKACSAEGAFSRQRIAVSRGFWMDEGAASSMIGFEHHRTHPHDFVEQRYATRTLERLRRGLYAVHDREPGDELPAELIPPAGDRCTL